MPNIIPNAMSNMPNMNELIGTHNIIWIVLDTLRYDVAQQAFEQGELPTLSKYIPKNGWEMCHTPASFTYPAHQAFFAGFLPTPAMPQKKSNPHQRLFAAQFTGSQSTGPHTFTFTQANVVHALEAQGYHTACIGGVGFFNPSFALGNVLPSLFQEQHWSPATSTGHKHCVEKQVEIAKKILAHQENKPLFLFINVPAIHSPNRMYLPDNQANTAPLNSLAGHAAALRHTDQALQPLFEALQQSANPNTPQHNGKPSFVIICSDHGTAYGEEGYHGHRLAHEVVWNVPYTHFIID